MRLCNSNKRPNDRYEKKGLLKGAGDIFSYSVAMYTPIDL